MVSFLYLPLRPLTDQEACRSPHGTVLNRRDLPRGQEGVPPWDVRYQRSGLPASGMNRLCPKRDFPNSPIKAWVAGATRKSASALALAVLTRGGAAQAASGVAQAAQAGRVRGRPDEEEIVVHHEAAVQEVSRVGEDALGLGRVRQHHVRVAAAAHRERLPAADGDYLHAIAALPLEHREQRVEQPGVAGGRGGGEEEVATLDGGGWWRRVEVGGGQDGDQEGCGPPPTSTRLHQPPPPSHLTTAPAAARSRGCS